MSPLQIQHPTPQPFVEEFIDKLNRELKQYKSIVADALYGHNKFMDAASAVFRAGLFHSLN